MSGPLLLPAAQRITGAANTVGETPTPATPPPAAAPVDAGSGSEWGGLTFLFGPGHHAAQVLEQVVPPGPQLFNRLTNAGPGLAQRPPATPASQAGLLGRLRHGLGL